MNNISVFLLCSIFLFTQGCSTEAVKRTGYETLQNIEDARCQRDLSSGCQERESYDEYQRMRQDLKTSE